MGEDGFPDENAGPDRIEYVSSLFDLVEPTPLESAERRSLSRSLSGETILFSTIVKGWLGFPSSGYELCHVEDTNIVIYVNGELILGGHSSDGNETCVPIQSESLKYVVIKFNSIASKPPLDLKWKPSGNYESVIVPSNMWADADPIDSLKVNVTTLGYVEEHDESDDVLLFVSNYSMSNMLSADIESKIGIRILHDDCVTPATVSFPYSTAVTNYSDGMSDVEVTFYLEHETVLSVNNSLFEASPSGGVMDFCVRLDVYLDLAPTRSVNFHETIYKLNVNLLGQISTTAEVVRTDPTDGGEKDLELNENVTAYQCDDSFQELDPPPILTNGDFISICVETEEDSSFEVEKVRDITVDQNGTKQFDYVVAYMDSLLATTTCIGINTTDAKCQVKMQLLGTYFKDEDPEDLTVSGVVKLAYLDSTGRRLMGNNNARETNLNINMRSRKLDGTVTEGAAAFDEVKVRLSALSDGPDPTLDPTVSPTVSPTPEPSKAPTSKPTATDDEEPVLPSPKVDGAEGTNSSGRNTVSHPCVVFLLTMLVGSVSVDWVLSYF